MIQKNSSSFRLLSVLAAFLVALTVQPAVAATVSGELVKWHTIVVDFNGPVANEMDSGPNPFLDYRLQVTFTGPSGQTYNVPGYFDGDGNGGATGSVWRARFAADEAGIWSYSASFRSGTDVAVSLNPGAGSPASFDGESGSFTVAGLDSSADGFLKYGRLESIGEYYFKFRDGGYWIKGGMDSPENFLGYDGFDNTPHANLDFNTHESDWVSGDPDWNSPYTSGENQDGRAIIGTLNYLASQNLNSIYFMPMNIGADGKDTWPYASESINRNGSSSNDNVHYDISKLEQWSTTLDHAQRKGIFLHFVLSDREPKNKNELDNATLGVERKLFYREMIARFGHHNALQWNISEEYNLALPLPPALIKEFAQYINDVDPYDHPVTVHNHGNTYVAALGPFVGDTRFGVFSVQTWQQPDSISFAIEHFRTESAAAGHIVPVAVDESIGIDQMSANEYRKRAIWDAMLSGGGHELFVRYQDSSLDDYTQFEDTYDYLWYARRFVLDNLAFWEMAPNDGLVTGENTVHGGAEVFTKDDEVYAIYLPSASAGGTLNLQGASGTWQQRWYNPRTGNFEGGTTDVTASGSLDLGTPPSSPSEDWTVLLQQTMQSGNTVFQQSSAGQGLVSMEAENYSGNLDQGGSSWVEVTPGGQSGAAAMESVPNAGRLVNNNYTSNSPQLSYAVDFVETGTHYVWIRGLGDSDGASVNDSVHVGLDGAAVSTADRISTFNSNYSWSSTTMDSSSRARIVVNEPGVHTIDVWMREDGLIVDKIVLTTDAGLDVPATYGAFGPSESPQGLAALPAPVITPASGTYTGSVDVTITAEPESTIYFTTDGSDPTTSSSIYGAPFTVTADTTVKAFAVQTGWADSAIVSADYVISLDLQPPTLTPPGGSYVDSVSVTMSPGAPGASVHYTTDGSTPTTASALYTSPITLTADTTVRAISAQSGFNDSAVVSETYTIVPSGGGGSGLFLQSTAGQGIVSMEAENYASKFAQGGKDWELVTPGGQSGAAAMQALPNTGTLVNNNYTSNSPQLSFEVDFVETGTHYVWVRGLGDSDGSSVNDSVHVGLDGAAVSTADRISTFNSNYSWSTTTMDSGSRARIEITSTGVHTIDVWMREDGLIVDKVVLTTDAGLDIPATYGAFGPGESPQGLPTLPAPQITPASGTYTGSVDVSIAAEPGSTIYFTTDGSDPTTSSAIYGAPFTVSSDTTVKAFAVQSGWSDSPIASADYVISLDLQPPTISPPGGSYVETVTVSMTPGTAGASVHYTTDGSTPTTASPLYTSPITLTVDTTVRAITAQSGFNDSAVVSETYTIVPSGGGGSGLFLQSTAGQGIVSMEAENYASKLAQGGKDWELVTPGGQSGAAAMQALPNTGTLVNNNFVSNSPQLSFEVDFVETGTHYVWIRGLGDSDGSSVNDSVHVGLDGAAVSTADRISTFNSNYSWSSTTMDSSSRARINITTPGVHTIDVWMREDGLVVDKVVLTTDAGLDIPATYGAFGPAESPQGLPTLPTPQITPASGTYTGSVDVTITAEPGSTIYFTTDGSDPTTSSSVYSAPILVTSDTTVKAFAVQSGWVDSAIASADYVISLDLQPPTISPPGGSYVDSVTVTMTPGTAGASVHYTTDGSTPTTASPLYTSPITLTADATVRAITALSGFNDSTVTTETYTVTTGGSTGLFLQSGAGQGLLSMEAENYASNLAQGTKEWVLVTPGGQSGAAAMQALPNTGTLVNNNYVNNSPQLSFIAEFVETGTHYVWIRGLGDSDGASVNDSVHVGLNGAAVSTADRISGFNSGYSWSSTTLDSSSRARIVISEPGVHTINVWMREDGLIVDKVVLTTDESLDVPSAFPAVGPPESPKAAGNWPTPVLSPLGGTFNSSLTVSIQGESGVPIYYTTDGSTPTAASTEYQGPLVLTSDTNVQAVSIGPGLSDSDIASGTYTQTECLNIRIMPLGDSITLGKDGSSQPPVGQRVSYRRELYFKLVEAGYNVDFVGSQDEGQLAIPAFDSNHEGHPGISDDTAGNNVFAWLTASPADYVLLHIGTNMTDPNAADVEFILDEIDRYSTDIHVVVAKIINRQTFSSVVQSFNNDLESRVAARIAAGDKLSIVDMENAITYPDDLVDNLHPNEVGYSKMADVWFTDLNGRLPACVLP